MTDGVLSTSLLSAPYAVTSVARTSVQQTWGARAGVLGATGDFTFDGILDFNPIAVQACDLHQYEEDFFNAVYFIPDVLSIDSVASETRVGVLVWNAFRTQRTISSLTETGFAGITVEGPEVGFVLQPLQLVSYDFVFSPAGPADIDANLTLGLDLDQFSAEIDISGVRSTQFFLVPNWRVPVERTYSFSSDISTGRSLRETRRQLRENARITISYTHTAFFFRIQRMLRFFHDNPDLLSIMPDWPSVTFLTQPALNGVLTLEVEGGRPWLTPGQPIFLTRSVGKQGEESFLTTIESVDGNTVTIQAETDQDWPVGTKVIRGLAGRVNASQSSSIITNNLAEIQITFVADPGQEMLYTPSPAIRNFQGREIFDIPESWAGAQTYNFEKGRIVNDVSRGRIQEISYFEYTPEILQLAFDQFSLRQVFDIEEFFLRQRGRVGEFWRSARLPDLDIVRNINAGDTSIEVDSAEVFEIYNDDPSKVAVEIELLDGTRLQRLITSFDTREGDDVTILVFNETFPDDILVGNVRRVSWLNVWRLSSDDLVMSWITDTVATTQLSMRSLVVEALDEVPTE